MELIFYLAIGLGATRSVASSGLLASLGGGAHALALLQGLPWVFRPLPCPGRCGALRAGWLLFHARAWLAAVCEKGCTCWLRNLVSEEGARTGVGFTVQIRRQAEVRGCPRGPVDACVSGSDRAS